MTDALVTNDCLLSSFRQDTSDRDGQSPVPGVGRQNNKAPSVALTAPIPIIQEQQFEHAEDGIVGLHSDPGPGHTPSQSGRPHTAPHGSLPQHDNPSASSTTNTSSTTSTNNGQSHSAESIGLPHHPSQSVEILPSQPGSSGSPQDLRLDVARSSRLVDNEMDVDGNGPAGPSINPRSPPSPPPNFSHPQHGRSGPASPGPSNNDRRQRNKSQDKILMDLGEGVTRMNSNLEALNVNLGVLKDFVKESGIPRSKHKRRNTEAQSSDDDGMDVDADDEEPANRGYRPPKRKTRGQNTLHVRPFTIRGVTDTNCLIETRPGPHP